MAKQTEKEPARMRAWVTGASRGLGYSIAVGLAAAGYDVAVTARSDEALVKVVSEIEEQGAKSLALPADVSDPDSVRATAGLLQRSWGGLDSCVAAAGISPFLKDAIDITDEEWRTVLGINLDGTFWTAREAARIMRDSDTPGSITVVSSIHAQVAGKRLGAYSASKGAVEALVKSLAGDWAEFGIRVNALAPGYFETDMTAGLRKSKRLAPARFWDEFRWGVLENPANLSPPPCSSPPRRLRMSLGRRWSSTAGGQRFKAPQTEQDLQSRAGGKEHHGIQSGSGRANHTVAR